MAKRVIIVGAGFHGLVTAKTYLQLDPDVYLTIIEGGRTVGGVWSDERLYPELYAQVTHKYFEFTDLPLGTDNLSPEGYISGVALNKYVREYAQKFDILRRIRFETWVQHITELPEGGWEVAIKFRRSDGQVEADVLYCDKLIVAIGTANAPEIPNIPCINFTAPVEHSQQMTKYAAALQSSSVQRVTVVGAAKAAYDAIFLAMKAGKQVDWIIRPHGRGPLSVYPARIFGITAMHIAFSKWFAKFSPSIDSTTDWWYYALHTNPLGIILTKIFWWIVTLICNHYAGYSRSENAEKLRPMPNSVFWCNAGCGLISSPELWDLFHNSNLVTVHRSNISCLRDNKVILENTANTSLSTDFVLFCTGWKPDAHQSMFAQEDWTRLGLPYYDEKDLSFTQTWNELDHEAESTINQIFPILSKPPPTATPIIPNKKVRRQYRRMVPPELAAIGNNSIVFLGQIYVMQTILHSEVQALWAVAYLMGNIKVPELSAMRREVAEWNAWSRKRYLHRGNTMPYAIYDQNACCDRLLKDLGVQTKRKSSWLQEIFSPYGPRDYVGLVQEYKSAQLDSRKCNRQPMGSEISRRFSPSQIIPKYPTGIREFRGVLVFILFCAAFASLGHPPRLYRYIE